MHIHVGQNTYMEVRIQPGNDCTFFLLSGSLALNKFLCLMSTLGIALQAEILDH